MSTSSISIDQQPTRDLFNAGQAITAMHITAIGAGIVMVVLGTAGLPLALVTGGQLGDLRAAYSAGLVAVVLAGQMVIAVGALRGHQAILQHQLAQEVGLAKRLHQIEDQNVRLEHLMTRMSDAQAKQSKVMGDLIEAELHRLRLRS